MLGGSNTPNIVVKIGDHPLPLSSEYDALAILDFLSGSLPQDDQDEDIADEPVSKASKKRNRKRSIRR